MSKYQVEMCFAVGDRETIAKFTLPSVEGDNPLAVMTKVDELFDTPEPGFAREDLVQITVTDLDADVAPNLLGP